MRNLLLAPALLILSCAANAQSLEVSIIDGASEPVRYNFPLSDQREQIDLREFHNYRTAFHDPASKRDICREGMFQTGLLLTLRPITQESTSHETPVEVIGQVSSLTSLDEGKELSCGVNMKPSIKNAPFSDTVAIKKNKSKVMVIDNKFTVILSIK